MQIYDRIRDACAARDTTITAVLTATGHSSGSTGSWKSGQLPRLDILIDIADYLHMTLDELVFGQVTAAARRAALTEEQEEWLDILDHIPEDRRGICRDFLRTHMVAPEKYIDKMSG